jgi:hypothetical protein
VSTIEQGTDKPGPSAALESTARRHVKIKADTLEHVFDNRRQSS